MKTQTILYALYAFHAWTELKVDAAGPKKAICRGERLPVDAGAPCTVLAQVRDRVLIELTHPIDGRPLYGWTELSTLL